MKISEIREKYANSDPELEAEFDACVGEHTPRKRRDRQLAAITATQADLDEDLEPEEMLGILAEVRAARRKRIDRG